MGNDDVTCVVLGILALHTPKAVSMPTRGLFLFNMTRVNRGVWQRGEAARAFLSLLKENAFLKPPAEVKNIV